jgi:hypothetical protein
MCLLARALLLVNWRHNPIRGANLLIDGAPLDERHETTAQTTV